MQTVEPTQGIDRLIVAVLCEAYKEYPGGRGKQEAGSKKHEASDGNPHEVEIVLHLKPSLAPFKAAVLPLVKKDGLKEKAEEE